MFFTLPGMMRAVILLLIAASAAVRGDDCIRRKVEYGIVCVCNSTYCDYVPDVQVQENQYVTYTSTESGQRLNISIGNFSNGYSSCDITITVDTSKAFQEIFGFGGAMTDAAALNIRNLREPTQQKLIEAYYGAKGSRYTFCRIPMAGTDFSTRPYTYADTPGDLTLSNFSLVEEDNYKIGYLHDMMKIMPNRDDMKIFTTSWSAPAWMKDTNKITWGALKPEYYQLYADYIRKFFDAYKEKDIDIWGMTPGNEPLDGYFPIFPFNAMKWTATTAANFCTKNLQPTLSEAGYEPTYMALDDQRFFIPEILDIMFKSDKAKELFTGTAYHWYANKLFSLSRLDKLHNEYPNKFILMTEACTGSSLLEREKVKLGSWERGEKYLQDIIENMLHWVSGWVDWNLALDKHGMPNWAKNYVDSPIIVMPENDEFYKQPMYYALYHVSKFVPRNSTRISSEFSYKNCFEDYSNVKAVAFCTNEGIVIVIMNKDNIPHNICIQDDAMSGKICLQQPEKSFTTLIYRAPQECGKSTI
ncbi:PREDICTED: glucosylceramidase-like isoform X2 [Dinoponera quadriceps]|nr:PREDICTED: glucosylceramidase-like isoform X2 [Dinoponera quadriceps]XP_014480399.1 PREDICTED: glucosylceramidase-like isoform X2 [Dinoponera quadriceps]XP_014480406.1 PREDICTED: glucosylceramidase-like isoform X2 [Dinoponera quadriceps]